MCANVAARLFPQCFQLEVVRSKDGLEFLSDASVVLVLTDFDTEKWDRLFKIKW